MCVLSTCPVCGDCCSGASRTKIKTLVKAAMTSQSLCLATHEVVEMFVCVRHLHRHRHGLRPLQNKKENMSESSNEITIFMLSDSRSG